MKKFKLLITMLISLVSLLIGNRAYAYTITIDGTTDGHTYEAYQIFKGDLYNDTLSNVTWGNGVNTTGQALFGDAAAKAETLVTASDAEKFSKEVSKYLQNPLTFSGTSLNVTEPGYYLIKDKDSSLSGDKSYTSYIMQVVKDVNVTTKSDTPKVEKKVKDINDSTTGVLTDWKDSADFDISDKVPFQLTASLPSDFEKYSEYYLEFKDSMSSGLTFNQDAKVYVVNGTEKIDVTNQFTIASDGTSYKINNLKSISGVTSQSKIVVEYSATLNSNAVLGSLGNPNSVTLSYSNNPNYTGAGETSTKGETPQDKVIVFTYKVLVNKVDISNNPLSGAEFTLSKKMSDGTLKEYSVVKNTEGTQFSFSGLDDGEYVLTETKTPKGYNSIAPITFTVVADHTDGATPELTTLSGDSIDGTVSFTPSSDLSTLSSNIVNKSGSLLPTTGGIGTKILYTIGGTLIAITSILLITKRRVEKK
ncbi:isopeptide-forming domain-containing fimbrial protein [Lactococcus lactis]|uniref:Isopeptide-forming domain-containing fimbrial protein n=2 Tax=Lactococcus lactis TaxID=1358 RepID=A0A9X4S2W0_9LACT|nr:isopeptide-forming domain-containing fimbrial protein [Lactococcus lactis]MDG4982280.1 isopeptide-forming domain-containing fimbrial protein [Lactococcus lactis]